MIFSRDKQIQNLAKEIERLTLEVAALRAEKKSITEQRSLEEKITALKVQVADLEINKGKKQEEFDRRERELTHMIGLEKKRQEIEVEQAGRDARLAVREENLKSERDQFEKQMVFKEKQFDGQIEYLQGMMKEILARLPSVTVNRTISEKRGK